LTVTLQEVKRALARKNLASYLEYVNHGQWQRARHLDLYCDTLEKLERREITRLIVETPPRHSKSETGTRGFPAWYQGRHPGHEVIIGNYGDDLASDFAEVVRLHTMEYGEELFGIRVAPGKSARDSWAVEQRIGENPVTGEPIWQATRGGVHSAGLGGSMTGRGADLLIIDDPIKDWDTAQSESQRQKVWNWFTTVASTRLAPGGVIVLIMTRWHEDDLAGRLLRESAEGGEYWHELRLPAIAEEGDILGRAPGEALWPERYPVEALQAVMGLMGPQKAAALYQQRPSPPAGTILLREYWQRYDKFPQFLDEVVQSWDMTFKDHAESDYVVGQVWGRFRADVYLLDQVRGQWDIVETIRQLLELSKRWPKARLKLIEDKANGPAVMSLLKREVTGLVPVEPYGSKTSRAMAVTPILQGGNVWLPEKRISTFDVEMFIDRCAQFPSVAHDDEIDACTQALQHYQEHMPIDTDVAALLSSARLIGR
jgi:predicted phage terminase large subunit-like protein